MYTRGHIYKLNINKPNIFICPPAGRDVFTNGMMSQETSAVFANVVQGTSQPHERKQCTNQAHVQTQFLGTDSLEIQIFAHILVSSHHSVAYKLLG